jgi:hypothetical protein
MIFFDQPEVRTCAIVFVVNGERRCDIYGAGYTDMLRESDSWLLVNSNIEITIRMCWKSWSDKLVDITPYR